MQYLADMGLSLNVGKCVYATTKCIRSIMVHLDRNNAVTPWVCLMAKRTVPYMGLRLDPKGTASMKERHVLRCEAPLVWCENTLGPASVPHEVMAMVVGGIVRYTAPYLSDTVEEVVRIRIVYSDLVGYQTSDIRLLWTITPNPPPPPTPTPFLTPPPPPCQTSPPPRVPPNIRLVPLSPHP